MRRWGIFLSTAVLFCLASSVVKAQDKTENNGDALFQKYCVMCHGATGKGDTPTGKALKAADFHDPQVMKMSEADLATIISKGKKMMPAFGNRISTTDIDNLISYIRTLQKTQ
jgi:mono/diheme cytochrome c family protein